MEWGAGATPLSAEFWLTVFQSYQDDVWMIVMAVCNGTLLTVEKI